MQPASEFAGGKHTTSDQNIPRAKQILQKFNEGIKIIKGLCKRVKL